MISRATRKVDVEPSPRCAGATGAGRGVLYIAFAKFYFMFAGLVDPVPAAGDPVARRVRQLQPRHRHRVARSTTSLVTGTIQAVSQFAAQEPEKARAVQAAGPAHARAARPADRVAFIAAAPLVVVGCSTTRRKTAPLMLAGLIVGGYSFYAVFVGTANGLRQFHKQAGLDITFATLRVAGLLGMAMAGLGVIGVIGGWVARGRPHPVRRDRVGRPAGADATRGRLPVRPMVALLRRRRGLSAAVQRADVRRHAS